MSDTIFAVYYQGSHSKGYLTITTDEEKAIEVARSHQGFPVAKWVDGKLVDDRYLDFSIDGINRIDGRRCE